MCSLYINKSELIIPVLNKILSKVFKYISMIDFYCFQVHIIFCVVHAFMFSSRKQRLAYGHLSCLYKLLLHALLFFALRFFLLAHSLFSQFMVVVLLLVCMCVYEVVAGINKKFSLFSFPIQSPELLVGCGAELVYTQHYAITFCFFPWLTVYTVYGIRLNGCMVVNVELWGFPFTASILIHLLTVGEGKLFVWALFFHLYPQI